MSARTTPPTLTGSGWDALDRMIELELTGQDLPTLGSDPEVDAGVLELVAQGLARSGEGADEPFWELTPEGEVLGFERRLEDIEQRRSDRHQNRDGSYNPRPNMRDLSIEQARVALGLRYARKRLAARFEVVELDGLWVVQNGRQLAVFRDRRDAEDLLARVRAGGRA